MRNVRRYYLENAEYFITIVTKHRRRLFLNQQNIEILKEAFHLTYNRFPFTMRAYVFLPEHLHVFIQPKMNSKDISAIVGITKRTFTQSFYEYHSEFKEKQLWQPRFHDHIIRDEDDLQNHFDYRHFNPVKHNLVKKPEEYPHSTFKKFLQSGEYDELGWGHFEPENINR